MNQKTIYAILLVLLLFVVGTALTVFFGGSDETRTGQSQIDNTILPDGGNRASMPTDNKIATGTAPLLDTAPPVQVRPLLTDEKVAELVDASQDLHDDNIYLLKNDTLYNIYFISHSKYFAVRMKKIPTEQGQVAAERYLSEVLGLSPGDLCKLEIDVLMPREYEPSQTTDLGLSQCPGPRKPSHGYGFPIP